MVALGNWRDLNRKAKETRSVSDRDSGLQKRVKKGSGGRFDGQGTTWQQQSMEWRERVEVGDRRAQG